MPQRLPLAARWPILVVPSIILSGSAFILPGSIRKAHMASHKSLNNAFCEGTSSRPVPPTRPACWGMHRRLVWPCMATILPDGDDDQQEDEAEDSISNQSNPKDGEAEPSAETRFSSGQQAENGNIGEIVRSDETTVNDIRPFSLVSRGDSLPVSYRSDNGTRESEFFIGMENEKVNPYFDVVRRLSPTELIGTFMKTSSPRVQEAVRTTVMGLLGSLPRHAFETTAVATGDALANLMFQLQMTGYMFKNAEYRLSLKSSMRAADSLSPEGIAIEGQDDDGQLGSSTVKMDDEGHIVISKPRISGKIQLTYFEGEEKEKLVEVDADAYMAELRGQVNKLDAQLTSIQSQEDEAVEKDLLVYIKSMPEHQLQSMTASMSPEVLDSMRLLVETVMSGMGNAEIISQTVTQQTGSGMAQLCMWQLVVGFNLREMEAREDLRKKFNK